MGALAPYIPAKDGGFNAWFNNFSTLITAAPATYGLLASDATAIAAEYTAWSTAYGLVTSPSTKTAATVSAKNITKVAALALVRSYAQMIANNAGVSAANKTALGLNPRTSTPQPITAPTTYPALTIVSASSLQQILKYKDSVNGATSKSKPYGVVQVQVFCSPSATAITDPTQLAFQQAVTKSPFPATFGSGAVGEKAYYAARYVTRKGLVGPWSPIVNLGIV